MWQPSIDMIVNAQHILMAEHDATSETALGLLVWAATERGVTVLEVASTICDPTSVQSNSGPQYATA